jgi:hypothetical protein
VALQPFVFPGIVGYFFREVAPILYPRFRSLCCANHVSIVHHYRSLLHFHLSVVTSRPTRRSTRTQANATDAE